eukprot:1994275-Prymnesium_polylepis.1
MRSPQQDIAACSSNVALVDAIGAWRVQGARAHWRAKILRNAKSTAWRFARKREGVAGLWAHQAGDVRGRPSLRAYGRDPRKGQGEIPGALAPIPYGIQYRDEHASKRPQIGEPTVAMSMTYSCMYAGPNPIFFLLIMFLQLKLCENPPKNSSGHVFTPPSSRPPLRPTCMR